MIRGLFFRHDGTHFELDLPEPAPPVWIVPEIDPQPVLPLSAPMPATTAMRERRFRRISGPVPPSMRYQYSEET